MTNMQKLIVDRVQAVSDTCTVERKDRNVILTVRTQKQPVRFTIGTRGGITTMDDGEIRKVNQHELITRYILA